MELIPPYEDVVEEAESRCRCQTNHQYPLLTPQSPPSPTLEDTNRLERSQAATDHLQERAPHQEEVEVEVGNHPMYPAYAKSPVKGPKTVCQISVVWHSHL